MGEWRECVWIESSQWGERYPHVRKQRGKQRPLTISCRNWRSTMAITHTIFSCFLSTSVLISFYLFELFFLFFPVIFPFYRFDFSSYLIFLSIRPFLFFSYIFLLSFRSFLSFFLFPSSPFLLFIRSFLSFLFFLPILYFCPIFFLTPHLFLSFLSFSFFYNIFLLSFRSFFKNFYLHFFRFRFFSFHLFIFIGIGFYEKNSYSLFLLSFLSCNFPSEILSQLYTEANSTTTKI